MEGTPIDTQKTAPNPWGTSPAVAAPCSLQDVMSEELAKEIQKEEDGHPVQPSDDIDPDLLQYLARDLENDRDTSNDLLMAQMLQHEFDKEHDAMVAAEEKKFNGDSKVTLSFTNYRSVHPLQQDSSDSDDDENWPIEDHGEKDKVPAFNKAGIAGKGKNIITKHDPNISGQRNATRVMETFPPEFETGDGRKINMRLPNNVYNKLKRHSQAESKKSARLHEKKEHSTAEHAIDAKTRLLMYKLVNNEILENINGVISTGKESVVFHADGGKMTEQLVPKECALKVYKTTLNEFKNRSEYVKGDFRLCRDEFKKQNPRKIIRLWAEKEHLNLKTMEKAGIPCPKSVLLKKHILVMSFIGEDQVSAPKLKEVNLSPEDAEIAYEQCVENMKKMYQRCGLVHGDLSEYNMLWHDDTVFFIDVSQSVEKMHPKAQQFLLRDCHNVHNFFSRCEVHQVASPYQLFNEITGLNFIGEGEEFLSQMEEYEKNVEKLTTGEGKDYAFEYFFQRATEERERSKQAQCSAVTKESVVEEGQKEETTQLTEEKD